MIDDDLAHDQYTIRRKVLTILGAQFHVYDAAGNVLLFSKQRAFKLKEDIRVFSDESMEEERLLIRAREAIDFSASYDVVDSQSGKKIGALRRKGMKSLFRDSWEFLDEDDQPIAKLEEDSLLKSLLRRGLSNLIPQRFDAKQGDSLLATYAQHFNPLVYKLDVTVHDDSLIDPRLALAGGILLAAVEGRQN